MKSFYLKTFGCKLNQADTASIRATLTESGMRESFAPEEADLIIVNSCTVTHRADRDARRAIRQLKRFSPDSRLIITGCYAERDARILASMPEVDEVFGLVQKRELFRYSFGAAPEDLDFGGFDPKADYGEKSRAFLKVQEGCDLRCSYCVIRLVRGQSRSLPAEEVIRRIHSLVKHGFHEVVLTGIHLGLWGHDLGYGGKGGGVLGLMKEISRTKGMPKIRLNSLDPLMINDELLDLMAHSGIFAQHLHLSIQSASPKILKAMKRRTDVGRMSEVVTRAREMMPNCGIGADVIVGFPGESDEDFQLTYDFLTSAPFTYAHVFSFSPRPGTEAAKMQGRVNDKIIVARSAQLRAAMAEQNFRFRSSMPGKKIEAVILQKNEDNGSLIALTDNYFHVTVADCENLDPKSIGSILITSVEMKTTYGRIA